MRITLDVYLPASCSAYEVAVENTMPVSQLTGLIAEAVGRMVGEVYRADGSALLCDRQSGNIFDIDMTPDELGLKNGSRVMLI